MEYNIQKTIRKNINIDKNKVRYRIYQLGLSFLFTTAATMIYTYFMGYFLSPDKVVIVHLNGIGEANFEFVMILFFIPLAIYFFIDLYSNVLPRIKRGEL